MRPDWRPQAYLQGIMEQYSNVNSIPNYLDIYRQCLMDCSDFEKFETSYQWFINKLAPESLPELDQEMVWLAEKNYQKRADLFLISQVPTIIINESYKIDANQAKTAGRMVEIIDFLLAM